MNKTSLIIMGGALLIAIVVASVVNMKLAPKTKKTVVTSGTEILVASKDLMAGEALKADSVRWQNFPDDALFGGVIKRKDQADDKKLDVYGRPLHRNIMSGEPVTSHSLINAKGGGVFLAASLRPGMRAAAIPVRAETTAGGFISPGDYVDVILTYQISLKGDAANYSDAIVQKVSSETIMSNIHVLAVDQNVKDDVHDPKVGRTVTLEVDKEGAQILATAATMGELSLSLRHLGEKDTDADHNVPITTDLTTSKVIQKIYKTAEQSKTNTNTVRVYNGNDVINVPVRAPDPVVKQGN